MTGQAAEDTVQFQRTLVKRWSRGLLGLFFAAGTFAAPAGDLPMRKSNSHGVTVTVIPQSIGAESANWEFLVAFDSHLPGLEHKLPAVAVLAGSHGTQQRAIEWEALPPGPFLRMGTLKYGAIAPLPNAIELRIAVAGEHKPRVFRWKLK